MEVVPSENSLLSSSSVDTSAKWSPLQNILSRPSPFGNETGNKI